MEISSLLKTDLDQLNGSMSILMNDRLSMHNNIYIFLKCTCSILKKLKHISW